MIQFMKVKDKYQILECKRKSNCIEKNTYTTIGGSYNTKFSGLETIDIFKILKENINQKFYTQKKLSHLPYRKC